MESDQLDRLNAALVGRYRIERELGSGGMATVCLAEDLKHRRKVAIKILQPEVAAAVGPERFLREIEIVAHLTHPHILALFDSGTAEGLVYYVTPFIEGESLRARLERDGQLSVEEALRLTREVASALGYAHARGLVHRDVKPENILLVEGFALLADFGVARAAGASEQTALTRTGVALGTPLYMSPEQVVGSEGVDGRSDLYSLACVLYEMLSGRPPFTGTSVEGLVFQHLSVEPRPVTDSLPKVPATVAAVVAKALSKTPAGRYATVVQFAEALAVAATGGGASSLALEEGKAPVPTNLPKRRTRFIGREHELAECTQALGETQLLTMTGVGGSGKTRLALELAARQLAWYPDGVWFVDLGPLADEHRVADTAAAALGVREESGMSIVETLVQHVARKCMLIVLDNCEHVLEASAKLVESLLAAAPELRLIATSRESLGVEGERSFDVRSLLVPPTEAIEMSEIEAADAVRLFVDRAEAAAPEFTLSVENAPTVAEICRGLDGIPLAIELAAARVEMLSLEQIRTKLDDRFRLLTGGKRAWPRHQTLRAAIQWSYDLLTPEAQRLYRRLAVFAGGWTLAAAAAVAGEGADDFDVLELLTHLVHKSLVRVEREEGAEPRYRMLETMRQYAAERLKESGEFDDARTRHLEFYVAFTEETRRSIKGPEPGEWVRRMDRELENHLVAHAWCDHVEGGGEKGLRLVWVWGMYWLIRGQFDLGLRDHREALERMGAEGLWRARVLAGAGSLALQRGLWDQARRYAEESLAVSRDLGDQERIGFALALLGVLATQQGDLGAARAYCEESVALTREIGSKMGLGGALNNLGLVLRQLGDLEGARRHFEESLAIMREQQVIRAIPIALGNLAQIEIVRGEIASPRARLKECIQCMEQLESKPLAALVMDIATGFAAAGSEWERAARFYGAADSLREEVGPARESSEARFLEPFIQQTRRELGEEGFSGAYARGRALAAEDVMNEVGAWLGGDEPSSKEGS